MGFRLAPRSMTLDDLDQNSGRPLFSNTETIAYDSGCIQHDVSFYGGVFGGGRSNCATFKRGVAPWAQGGG